MSRYKQFTATLPEGARKQLKQALASGVELWRAAGWKDTGLGDQMQWEAVVDGQVVGFWSSEQRGVFVGRNRFSFLPFRSWKQRILNLDPKEL